MTRLLFGHEKYGEVFLEPLEVFHRKRGEQHCCFDVRIVVLRKIISLFQLIFLIIFSYEARPGHNDDDHHHHHDYYDNNNDNDNDDYISNYDARLGQGDDHDYHDNDDDNNNYLSSYDARPGHEGGSGGRHWTEGEVQVLMGMMVKMG